VTTTKLVESSRIEFEHEFKHAFGGMPIEISRGLVREHACGFGHQRASQCCTLALASGQFAWGVAHTGAQPTRSSTPLARRLASSVPMRLISNGIATFSSAVNSGSR
jgi:hypothetical protein